MFKGPVSRLTTIPHRQPYIVHMSLGVVAVDFSVRYRIFLALLLLFLLLNGDHLSDVRVHIIVAVAVAAVFVITIIITVTININITAVTSTAIAIVSTVTVTVINTSRSRSRSSYSSLLARRSGWWQHVHLEERIWTHDIHEVTPGRVSRIETACFARARQTTSG